ncbi:peptidoglycan-binding domain-containing protein [Calothrix rhizosoleniae]|uniref:peptidoglycan-binding domain-containing protein n=1 Tax=Calothrix rhizosoleniae TaxID=888997 RepID=UPI000B49D1B3|nr:peptidoglycan-binding protein [Calothrix rhizosoleniae]
MIAIPFTRWSISEHTGAAMRTMEKHNLTSVSTEFNNIQTMAVGGDLQLDAMSNGQKTRKVAIPLGTVIMAIAIATVPWQAAVAQIRQGEAGNEVKYIQNCLKKLGYFKGRATGYFGPKTETSVRNFQQDRGISAIGVVGPRTQRALQRRCRRNVSSRTRRRNIPRNQPRSRFSNLLQIGSSGDAVIQLQQNLQRLGFYRGAITGNFQDMTMAAVMEFQQSQGLLADGVVGRRTQGAIRRQINPNPNPTIPPTLPSPDNTGNGRTDTFPNAINQGDVGNRVVELQRALKELRYFNVNPTGVFGNVTRDAVIRFQQDNQLVPSGIADAQTIAAISQALDKLYTGCTPARGDICVGESSQRVTALQQRLQQRGFFRANPTGYYGQLTSAAVAQFQRSSGLNPTGFVDARTFQALGLSNNSQNRYVVVVPLGDNDTLNKVRQLVPQAFQADSPLGAYVNAGNFRDRSDAERVSRMLRSQGFDARVKYF